MVFLFKRSLLCAAEALYGFFPTTFALLIFPLCVAFYLVVVVVVVCFCHIYTCVRRVGFLHLYALLLWRLA